MTGWKKFPVLIVCGYLGYVAMGYLNGYRASAEVFLRLWTEQCASSLEEGGFEAPDTFEVFRVSSEEVYHIDPASGFALELSDVSCTVSDVMHRLDGRQRLRLEAQVLAFMSDNFRELAPLEGDDLDDYDLYHAWVSSEFPVPDPRRWGVHLSRHHGYGDHQTTYLTLSLPREAD